MFELPVPGAQMQHVHGQSMSASWIERRTADGSSPLAHPSHGETLHSLAGAWTQARERYAQECRLSERVHDLVHEGRWTLHLGEQSGQVGDRRARVAEPP